MSKLYFNIDDIRKVVADSLKAKQSERRPSLGELLDAGAYDDKFQPIPNKVEAFRASAKPGLQLVHDEGIYIMPNAWFEKIAVAYAIGCDPNQDGDVWQHCRKLVGGDDFCEAIPMEAVQAAVSEASATKLIVHFTSKSLRFGVVRKKLGNN